MDQLFSIISLSQLTNFIYITNLLAIGSWGIIELILGVYWRIALRKRPLDFSKFNKRIFKGLFVFTIVVIILWTMTITYEPEFIDTYPPYIE